MESAKPALILPKDLIKQFGGSLCDANETFQLPYSLSIDKITQKSDSLKRKSTED